MGTIKGASHPEKMRTGRDRLTVRDPLVQSALAAIDIPGTDIDGVMRCGNRLAAAARLWVARGGYAERGRVTRADAERMYRRAFAREGAL